MMNFVTDDHEPVEGEYDGSHFVDCQCLWRGGLWGSQEAARAFFLQHLVKEAVLEIGWDDTTVVYTVEFEEERDHG